jgi:hypothetical protein
VNQATTTLMRASGAFAKDVALISELLWADYFRPGLKKSQLQNAMDDALALTLAFSKHPQASYLPVFTRLSLALARADVRLFVRWSPRTG